jgi:phage-related protein
VADAIVTDVLARISADASNFVRNMSQAAQSADAFGGSLKNAGNSMNGANQQIQSFAGGASIAHKTLMGLGAVSAIAGGAMISFGVISFRAAAQVNEMDVAMRAVGNATGLGYTALKKATIAVRDNGIEMASAQQMVLLYAKANLQLADAQKVARVAQDLAVLSGSNSTDTAMRLTYAIMNQDTLMLRNLGITKTASQAYQEYAVANNTSAKALTEFQKKQAITNMVIAEGAKVAGVYEAAMKEPAKVLRSFPRLFNDIQVAVGQGLTAAFGPLILSAYNATKSFTHLVREGGALAPVVDAIGRAFTYMVAPVVAGMNAFKNFLDGIQKTANTIKMYRERVVGVAGASAEIETRTKALADTFARFLPIIASVGTGLSIFFGRGLLQGIPVIGNLVGGLNPLIGALVALVMTTPALQEAFVNLFKAFAPLKDMIKEVAGALGGVLAFAVASVVAIINGLAKVILTATTWMASHKDMVYALAVGIGVATIAYQLFTNWTAITTAVTKGLTVVLDALAIAFSWPVIAIVALVAAFVYLWRTSETFRNVITQVIDQVAKVIGAGVAFILNTFAGLLEGFAKVMGQGGSLRDLFILVFNGIIKVVGTVIAGVIGFFAELLLAYSSLISSGSFVAKAMTAVWTYIGEVIKTFVVYFIKSIANIVGFFAGLLEAVGAFGEGFTQGFNKIGKVVADFAKGTLRILGKLLTGVFSAAKNLVKAIVDAIKGVFDGGNNSAEEAAKSVGSWTDTVFKFSKAGANALRGLERGLNGTADKISSINVKGFVEGVITGLSNGAKTAGTFLNGIAQKITDFANKDFGTGVADTLVKAALVAAAWLRSAATNVLDFTSEGFTKNLTDGISGFLDLIDGMFNAADKAIGNNSETLFDPVVGAIDDIANGADSAAKNAAERLKRVTDAAKSALSEIQKQAQQVLAFSDQVKKGINDFGGIATLAPDQGVPVTANMIIDNMRQRLAKITAFGNDLRALAGLGLNNASLQELISAGPVAGGAMAAALLKEGQSAVSQVNTFQGGIDLAGSAIGDIAARSQFGMGTVEAQGVVNTTIEVKEGAVQINFGDNLDSATKTDIRDTINAAITQAMADLARELANARAA